MGLFDWNKKAISYDEGYSNGQQYGKAHPGLRERSLARAQCQINDLCEELGLDEDEQAQYGNGFYDGYKDEPYDPPSRESAGFSLRHFFGL